MRLEFRGYLWSNRASPVSASMSTVVPMFRVRSVFDFLPLLVDMLEVVNAGGACPVLQCHTQLVYLHRRYLPTRGGFTNRTRDLTDVRLNQVLKISVSRALEIKHQKFRHLFVFVFFRDTSDFYRLECLSGFLLKQCFCLFL